MHITAFKNAGECNTKIETNNEKDRPRKSKDSATKASSYQGRAAIIAELERMEKEE